MTSWKKIAVIISICLVWLPNAYSQLNPYLGLTPPDSIPKRFGNASMHSNGVWWWHGSPKFSPAGTEMFFAKYHNNLEPNSMKIYVMQENNCVWTSPVPPSFVSLKNDTEPVYSNDGNRLFFVSDRDGSNKIYYVNRITDGWSEPQIFDLPYTALPGSFCWDFSFADNGTIYFSVWESSGSEIYKSQPTNGVYTNFEKLPAEINTTAHDFAPCISRDEKYLIFGSQRSGGSGLTDIYISFKKPDGSWNPAQNLGNKINGPSEDAAPSITFDNKYLFFNSAKSGDYGYNAYWVDLKVINKFNPYAGINDDSFSPPSGIELFQNYPNPFNPTTTIKFSLSQKQFAQISIYNVKGELVAELGRKLYEAGSHSVEFKANGLDSGQYFYQLKAGNVVTAKKMLVIK